MKKKVALLLALVMVLSLLPMSVFGARPGQLLNPRVSPPANPVGFTVRIDAAAFSGLTPEVVQNAVLDLRFDGGGNRGFNHPNFVEEGHASNVYFNVSFSAGPDFAVSSPSAATTAQVIEQMRELTVTRQNRERVMVNLFSAQWANGIPVLDGFVDIQINGINANPGETLAVYLSSGGDGIEVTHRRLLAPTPLAGQWNNGVTITTGAPTNIGMFAVLPSIRITENAVGRLVPTTGTSSFMVRLVAPRGFRWSTTLAATTRQGPALSVSSSGGVSGESIARHNYPHTGAAADRGYLFNEITQRSELYLQISGLQRGAGFLNQTTNQYIEISGLSLIPVEGAATAGTLGIDVYVGSVQGQLGGVVSNWGAGMFAAPNNAATAQRPAQDPNRNDDTHPDTYHRRILGSYWAEHTNNDGNQHWRARNLDVVHLERIVGNITVAGPANIETINSGSWHLGDTWLNGNYHTIQLIENAPGVLFSTLNQFEFRPTNDGVRIIDFQTRVRRGTDVNVEGNWGDLALQIPVLTDFRNGALTFAPMHDRSGWNPVAHRVEVRLALSVEAGYQARFGDQINIEVLRDGASIGTVQVANVQDMIEVVQIGSATLDRPNFDVIGPETVSSFLIRERAPGVLAAQNELHFSLQSFRDGVPINLGQWNLNPHVGTPTTNEAASGMLLAPRAVGGFEAVTILRQSMNNAGEIRFDNVQVSGPVVRGVDWHVLVYGPQIAPNSSLWVYRNSGVPTGELTGGTITALSARQQRGVFYYLPYHANILSVVGDGVPGLDVNGPGNGGQGNQQPGQQRVYWTHAMPHRHGAPVLYVHGGATLVQSRVFTDDFGGTINYMGGGTVRAAGNRIDNGQPVVIYMQLNQPIVTINGYQHDIATFVGQPSLAGQIVPVNAHGRTFVPGRMLANAFGIEFGSAPNGIRWGA